MILALISVCKPLMSATNRRENRYLIIIAEFLVGDDNFSIYGEYRGFKQ